MVETRRFVFTTKKVPSREGLGPGFGGGKKRRMNRLWEQSTRDNSNPPALTRTKIDFPLISLIHLLLFYPR